MQPTERLPINLSSGVVEAAWLDYNSHMNDAYYLVPFSRATDVWMDAVGLDANYRTETGCTIYSAEAHLVYLRELTADAVYDVSGTLLAFDEKRMHLFMAMHHTEQGYLAATCEWMLIHVNRNTGKGVALPGQIRNRLGSIFMNCASYPPPPQAGRTVSIKAKRP